MKTPDELETLGRDATRAYYEWRRNHTLENRTLKEMFYAGYFSALMEQERGKDRDRSTVK